MNGRRRASCCSSKAVNRVRAFFVLATFEILRLENEREREREGRIAGSYSGGKYGNLLTASSLLKNEEKNDSYIF